MATGTEIISYKGDAGKALASSPGALSVIGDTNTTGLSQTARDVAMMSFNANQIIYKQKIADRDAAFKLLDDDQLIPDNILEDDRARINGKLKKLQDIFYENSGDIMSDPKKYRDFIKATQEAKNDIKQAQKWYVGEKALLEEKQKYANNPIEQAKYDAHRLKMRGKKENDFYSLPDPFVPTTDFDLATTAQPGVTNSVTERVGEDDVTTTTLDPLATFNKYQQEWSDPKKNHWFSNEKGTGYVDMFLNGPKAKEDVARINKQLEQKNLELGLQPGDPGYITQLGVQEDPAQPGAYIPLGDRPDQIAAKIAMADTPAVVTLTKFNKDRAGANIDREKIAADERADKRKTGLGYAQLDWDKEKWTNEQKGEATDINAAAVFAERMYKQIEDLAVYKTEQGEVILTPDAVRKMSSEQLKYLGIEAGVVKETDEDGVVKTTTKGLIPFKVGDAKDDKDATQYDLTSKDVLVLKNGTIRVMEGAVGDDGKVKRSSDGGILGKYNPNKTRTVGTIATNRYSEQIGKAGGKELFGFAPIDRGVAEEGVSTTGGSSKQSGSQQQGQGNRASLQRTGGDGQVYTSTDGGVTWVAPDGQKVTLKK